MCIPQAKFAKEQFHPDNRQINGLELCQENWKGVQRHAAIRLSAVILNKARMGGKSIKYIGSQPFPALHL